MPQVYGFVPGTSNHPRAVSTSSASTNSSTPVIIGVSVGLGCFVLLIVGWRVWKCARGRSKAPLPPKGALAHDRQRQMTTAHAQPELGPPLPKTFSPGFAPFANERQYGDHSRHTSYRTDESSIFQSSPSGGSSQVHLMQSPSESEENVEYTRPRRPSFGSSAGTIRNNHYSPKHRSLSYAGSVHSTRSRQSSGHGTVRGAPHARHNRVDIVLPQPLAPGLYNHSYNQNGTLQQLRISQSRASSRERRPESSREDRILTDNLHSTSQTHAISPNYPPTHIEYPPPVPQLPVGYTNSPVTTSPGLSDSLSPISPEDRSPTPSAPLLSNVTPSSESGPPPLPPPKDAQPQSSQRTHKHGKSAHGRQRP